MVNLVRITADEVIEEIVDANYFNLYDLYAMMFGVEETESNTGVYYEMYKALLPYVLNGDLYYPAQPHRQAFCRLLWDRHCYFSIVADFSYRNWIHYDLADINWAISDDQVARVWQRIDEQPTQRLLGMRERSYYY
jgi:hypothetical protein